MSNLVLYKDTPNVLKDFGMALSENLKMNLNARHSRYRYNSEFKNGNYKASNIKKFRSGHRRLNNTRELSRSINYFMAGLSLYVQFNEYGVMLDRGADGIKLRQMDSGSFLYGADIDYGTQKNFQKEIERWSKSRGLYPRKKKKYTVGKRLKNTEANRRRMNFLITRSIANRGQNATFWFTNPYKALSKDLPDNLIFGMHKTIDDAFDNIFTKWR